MTRADTVLCVDLDGTLIKTDSLFENLIVLFRRNPFYLFAALFWLYKGKAYFKKKISTRASVNAAFLPYNEELLSYLRNEHARGRKIVLATASDYSTAEKVAEVLGIFSAIFASDGKMNLGGENKARTLVDAYGEKGFVYAGNEEKDAAVWKHAASAIVVSNSQTFITEQSKRFSVSRSFLTEAPSVQAISSALRIHQWVKNLLLFLPLIAAHQFLEQGSLTNYLFLDYCFAFLAFCVCASSVYLLNDLFDLEADRAHPTKRLRPFASGVLSLRFGFILTPLLLITALLLGSLLSTNFVFALIAYLVLTSAYSWYFKQIVLLDIIMLATLYSLRIFAGGIAGAIAVSQWLLAFSMFFFFSLAAVKRLAELYEVRRSLKSSVRGRGYLPRDLEQISVFGITSGYIAALVITLYASDPSVARMYSTPQLLWLLCPLLLYWISRIFLITQRGGLHEDPVVFALRDKVSYLVLAISTLILCLAV